MSKLRIVVLETDDADASTVAAIGNMIREMQNARGVTTVEHLAEPLRGVEPAGDAEAPRALSAPAPAKRTYKPRAPKPAAERKRAAPEGGRASNAATAIRAAVAKNGRVDKSRLATSIYGNAEPKQVTKLTNILSYLVRNGKLSKSADGTYGVL